MSKNLSICLTVCFISILSFSGGYLAGDFSKKEKDDYVEGMIAKQIQALERVSDASMFSSEPYNSFNFSTILLEAIVEQPDTALSDIETILVQELTSRKSSVAEYCKSRATEQFRSLCISTIEKSEELVELSGT